MNRTAARHPEEPQGSRPQPADDLLPDAPVRPESAYAGADEQGAGIDAREAKPGAAAMDEQGFKKGDICGDWKIERFVAAGGMGEVYEVRGTFGGKRGALKTIRSKLSTRANLEERFETEVSILATLECPYIVRLLHAGRHNGAPYLVMEWLEGMTLRDFLNQRRAPIGLADALHIAICIATALCAAHAEGVLHRDLKPENIFMVETGTLKVVDFGLAKWAGSSRVSTSEQLGGGLCTVHYAAPEQLERTGVDDRTDVRAAALVFLELVTLTYAFADKPGVLPAREIARAQQLHAEPNSLRELLPGCPESLAALIDAALNRDKTKRPHSTELLAALRAERRALRDAEQTAAPPIEEEDSADQAAPGPAHPEPAHETSAVRVIRQLRTATLPPGQPPGDPTAAGNPGPVRLKTIKMVRPPEAELEAAQRAEAARVAAAQHAATGVQAGDTTGGGRSATLPPEWSSVEAASMPQPTSVAARAVPGPQTLPATQPRALATMPRTHDTLQSHDDSAAARASLELAIRPTLPWKRALPAQDATPSLSPTHRGPSIVDGPRRPRIPMWVAPVLGMTLTFATFVAIKVVQAHGRHAHQDASTTPTATAAPTAAPAEIGTAAPTATAEATAAPTATASPATASAGTAAQSTPQPAPTATAATTAVPPATGAAPRATAPAGRARVAPRKPPPPTPAEQEPFVRRKPDPPKPASNRLFGTEP